MARICGSRIWAIAVLSQLLLLVRAQTLADEWSEDETSAEPIQPTNEDEERLAVDMFRGYNNLIRPSPCNNSTIVHVEFGVAMILLINVDEKNQIMQTNVWLTLKWNDCQFNWNPADYRGLTSMRVPEARVWVPDIVLFNNADGNYEVSYRSNVEVDYKGNVVWVPPAIYKSSCRMDVEFFPFDEQTCQLIFGSWTYNSREVQLKWYNNKKSVELEDYSYSGIWDVMDVPGALSPDRSKMKFEIVIRRKTLFYTVILIIPTVLMAFLSMLVFYLPAECSEKITLGISILLALVVFLLLVSKILPPTSDTIPLMAKYLLLTFILNIVAILTTVIIVNVYFRSPDTHTMPPLVRHLFLHFLPRVLMMKRPERIAIFNGYFVEEYCVEEIFDASLVMPSITATILPFSSTGNRRTQHHWNCSKVRRNGRSIIRRSPLTGTRSLVLDERIPDEDLGRYKSMADELLSGKYTFGPTMPEGGSRATRAELGHEQRVSQELKTTVESIAFIADHMKNSIGDKKVRDDWKYIAMVVDRLLLLIFFGITFGGTIGIIFSAPHVFEFVDQHEIIRRLIAESRLDAAQGMP